MAGTEGAFAIIFAGILPEIFLPTVSQASEIACGKQLTGCSGCEDEQPLLDKKHWQERAVQMRLTEEGMNFFDERGNIRMQNIPEVEPKGRVVDPDMPVEEDPVLEASNEPKGLMART